MFDDIFDEAFAHFGKAMKTIEDETNKFQQKFESRIKDIMDTPSMFGKPYNYKKDTGEDATSTWTHETWTDASGMFKYSRKVVKSKGSEKVTKEEEVKKPTVDELKAKMAEHANNHEYEEAAKLRDLIKTMEK